MLPIRSYLLPYLQFLRIRPQHLIHRLQAKDFLELGVRRAPFAEHVLRHCPTIERYYMLDPWRHLDDWNKPGNFDQSTFDNITLWR